MTIDPVEGTLLRRAIELSRIAQQSGNPPYGSLLAGSAGIIAEETNTTVTDDDLAAHPEMKLARWAARHLSEAKRANVTMYTSCEPCPMCADAIGRARIPRVVFALSTRELAEIRPKHVPVPSVAPMSEGPFLEEDAAAVVRGYYSASAQPEVTQTRKRG